jgi:hypothetical protein
MAEQDQTKLDKSKPYGEVVGSGTYRYEQNGLYYDADGNLVQTDNSTAQSTNTDTSTTVGATNVTGDQNTTTKRK